MDFLMPLPANNQTFRITTLYNDKSSPPFGNEKKSNPIIHYQQLNNNFDQLHLISFFAHVIE